jgi:hypothetical protein
LRIWRAGCCPGPATLRRRSMWRPSSDSCALAVVRCASEHQLVVCRSTDNWERSTPHRCVRRTSRGSTNHPPDGCHPDNSCLRRRHASSSARAASGNAVFRETGGRSTLPDSFMTASPRSSLLTTASERVGSAPVASLSGDAGRCLLPCRSRARSTSQSAADC